MNTDPQPREIVAPNGRPARRETSACPRCHAGQDKRISSGSFGSQHDVCGNCGWDFEELTCQS